MSLLSRASSSARPAVSGGARLRYVCLPALGTRLKEQWVRPPLYLAKAYNDKDWTISLLGSPTAGLLDGDVLEVNATVTKGAKAALISPAACRVHTMGSGHATVRQHYTVESGGALDVWPAPLILQKEASLIQETRLDVAASATVLLCEVVSPGRVAHGERFEFTNWTSRLRIYLEGELLAYENFACRPKAGDALDWQQQYPGANYASMYFLTPEPLEDLVQNLHDLETPNATIGASALREGGLGVKILAADGISLRQTIFSVRNLLISKSKIDFPQALKRAQTFFY
jgi:urease accessory protein